MSSTYSTNLRTELIGSGDQAGTWGTTTNTTLGSILEQAIAGVSGGPYVGGTYPAVNFPTDADITLTANNGSVDQARSAVLVVTSSTTGGQSIQIKYATGTAVLIPNGQTYPVYGDGSNFYLATTSSVPSGSIQMWSTATAPTGYILCNGVAISRTTYSTLYGVIGTTFGVGDGSTTFNVPNYTNRMPYGTTIGATGGSTTIDTANLPSHTHTFTGAVTTTGNTSSAYTGVYDSGHSHASGWSSGGGGSSAYLKAQNASPEVNVIYTSTASANLVDPGHYHSVTSTGTASGTTNGTGSGTAFIPPYLGINFIIKT